MLVHLVYIGKFQIYERLLERQAHNSIMCDSYLKMAKCTPRPVLIPQNRSLEFACIF